MAKKKRKPEPPMLDTIQLFWIVSTERRITHSTRCILDALDSLKREPPGSTLWRAADHVLLATRRKQNKSLEADMDRLANSGIEQQEQTTAAGKHSPADPDDQQ